MPPDPIPAAGGGPRSEAEAMELLAALIRHVGMDDAGRIASAASALIVPRREGTDSGMAEARYRALVEQIPAVTFVASLEGGSHEIYVSPQIESLLGFTQAEWVSSPILWFTQIHPDDRARISTGFATAVMTGSPFRGIFRVFARDGKQLWVHGEARFVADAEGRPRFLQGVAFDVTEQQRAEEMRRGFENERLAREQSEREKTRLFDLFASLPAAVAILSGPDHVVEFLNPMARDLAGDEAVGKPFREAFPDLAPQVPVILDPVYREGVPYAAKEQGFAPPGSGRDRHFNFVCQPLRDGSRVTGILIHSIEVTQEVQASRAVEEALRMREDFLSMAAHELMTPMTAMSLAAQAAMRAARKSAADPNVVDRLESVSEQVNRLMRLGTTLLDATRLGTGRLALEVSDVDLGATVSEVIEHAIPPGARASIRLKIEEVLVGRWDKLRVAQIATNLIGNAIKYGGGRTVAVTLDREGAYARLRVRDQGVGISQEEQKRLFTRFERGKSAETQTGFGLGLWISRQLAEAMGGRIEVSSALHQGSTFTLLLPLSS